MNYQQAAEKIRNDLTELAERSQKNPNDPDLWDLQRAIATEADSLNRRIKKDIDAVRSHVYDLEEQQQALYGVTDAIVDLCQAFKITKPKKARAKRG